MFESKGLKRTLSVLFFLAAKVPQLSAYAALLETVASVFGIVGIAHAGVAKVKSK